MPNELLWLTARKTCDRKLSAERQYPQGVRIPDTLPEIATSVPGLAMTYSASIAARERRSI